MLALHGMSADAWRRFSDRGFVHYEVLEPGFKYNLTDLAASIGLHQLVSVEERWSRRRTLWEFYQRELAGLPLHLPAPPAAGTRHALHLFTCLIDDTRTTLKRDDVMMRLHDLRIGTGVHYRPVHQHQWYRRHLRRTHRPLAQRGVDRRTHVLDPAVGRNDRRRRARRGARPRPGLRARMTLDLSLIVPCYNEAPHLEASVRAVIDVLDAHAVVLGDRLRRRRQP